VTLRGEDGMSSTVETDKHPDPLTEAIRGSICEAELMQAIGRGRGVRRNASCPLDIVILGNVPLPIKLDTVAAWEPLDVDNAMMAEFGAVPSSAEDAAELAGMSRDAVKKSRGRSAKPFGKLETNSYSYYLYEHVPSFGFVGYRREGSRGPSSGAAYDAGRIPDPVAWLEKLLGPLTIGAERIPGHRESHSQGTADWSAEALGRGPKDARRDRSSARPQGSRRCRDHSPSKHHPGVVSQACRPQVRWFKGASKSRQTRISREVEELIVRMASENRGWGYDRITGALANLGYAICDQTVGNVLRRHGLPPAPERKRTNSWTDFIRMHMELLAGTNFFMPSGITKEGATSCLFLGRRLSSVTGRCGAASDWAGCCAITIERRRDLLAVGSVL
jgi:hypothetical protein